MIEDLEVKSDALLEKLILLQEDSEINAGRSEEEIQRLRDWNPMQYAQVWHKNHMNKVPGPQFGILGARTPDLELCGPEFRILGAGIQDL